MNNKYILGILLIGFLLGTIVGIEMTNYQAHRPPRMTTNVILEAETAAYGDFPLYSGNLITNIGERFLRNTIAYDNQTNGMPKWISLSNDATPAVTWTKLAGENVSTGFGRAAGTLVAWYRTTDYSYNCTHKFTSGGAVTVQCAGLQWNATADSDSNLFACAAFTPTTFALLDNITITWIVQFDAN
jgi:hypothetical protein